jgi:predicted MPP superfamily phosphohydrolase
MPLSTIVKTRLKITLAGAFAVSCVLGLWAFWLEPASISVRHVGLRVPAWHAEHGDMKIALLTDLHVGAPHVGPDKLRRVVALVNEEKPDLILILGDLVIQDVVGGDFVAPERIADELKNLRATHGVVAVLGNHDWWLDGNRVGAALRAAGVTVLENQALRRERGGRAFWIAGVADLWTREPDMAGTLRQVESDDPVLLITHNPDIFPDVPSRVSLTIAGHTHGGQVNFPFVGRLVVPSQFGQRYALGHIVEGGRHLFVSGGVGTSIIPVRFRVPPEVVMLTLEAE